MVLGLITFRLQLWNTVNGYQKYKRRKKMNNTNSRLFCTYFFFVSFLWNPIIIHHVILSLSKWYYSSSFSLSFADSKLITPLKKLQDKEKRERDLNVRYKPIQREILLDRDKIVSLQFQKVNSLQDSSVSLIKNSFQTPKQLF